MPLLKIYDLFISHAWRYGGDYERLVSLLRSAPNFQWRNYSVPEHDPKIDPDTPVGKKVLLEELRKQIRPVNCVLIISGMYVVYSEWIEAEINIAQRFNKPIIGIKPRGQERIPYVVQQAAIEMVGWMTDSVVAGIREHSL